MKRLTLLSVLLLIALTALILLSFEHVFPPDAPHPSVFLSDQVPKGYEQLIAKAGDGLLVERNPKKYLLHLLYRQTAYVMSEEVRIKPRLDAGFPGRFFPHYLSTVVFVVPSSSETEKMSFAGLRDSNTKLYIPETHRSRILPAMAITLGEDGSLDKAVSVLAELKREGRLIVGFTSTDYEAWLDGNTVALMPDDEAAALIMSGLPVKIQVPSDGTLSFTVGLYAPSDSSPELPIDSDKLIAAGLRSLDGKADPAIYPSASSYAEAQSAITTAGYIKMLHDTVPAYRRGVMGTYLFSTADGSERVAVNIPIAILLFFWGVSLYWRVVQPTVRRLLQLQTGFLLFWMLIQLLKQSADILLSRYLWYLYYLPLIGSVVTFSLVAYKIAGASPELMRKIRPALIVSGGLLFLMVLTNDLHQLVFSFPAGLPQYEPYLHRPGFFLLAAWIVLITFGGLLRLYRCAGRRRNRRYINMLSLLMGAIVLYNALYVAGIEAIRHNQMGTVFIIFIILFWELTLRSGLIPYNRYYGFLFQFSHLPLYLLESGGRVFRQSSGAQPLPEDVIAGTLAGKRLFFAANDRNGELGADYEAVQIPGGFVVWKNDLQGIRRLNESLRKIRQTLLIQTALLEKQVEQENKSQELSIRRRLLEQVDDLIRPRLDEVGRLAGGLSASLPREQFQTTLQRIIDSIGYCKRAGLLHLSVLADGSVPIQQLVMLLQETCSYSTINGLEAALYGEPVGTIRLHSAVLYLDFFRDLLSSLRKCETGSIFGYASTSQGSLTISLLSDLPPVILAKLEAFAENKQQELAAGGITLRLIQEEPCLRMVLSEEEESHG